MMNTLDFTQSATVLRDIVAQATGKAVVTPVTDSDFVAVGQLGLLAGYDNLLKAISQVLGRTIFKIRPYDAKFKGLQVSEQIYGNMVRKLYAADQPPQNDSRMDLVPGQHNKDMFDVQKNTIVQENFYGYAAYERGLTIYRDQLNVAFSNAEEFGRFIAMLMQNASDMMEQDHETFARNVIGALIAGRVAGANASPAIAADSVVHLLTEYNAATGKSLTNVTLYAPENYPAFVKWAYARVAAISSLMTERSSKFQTVLDADADGNERNINLHTPYADQRVYLYAPDRYGIESRVLADTFHDNYLRLADTESVNFWQNINEPMKVSHTATFLKPDGTLQTGAQATEVDNIFGVIADRDAMGYTVMSTWSAPTPFEARGGYTNIWYHFTDKYWISFLEKSVVLLLD